MSKSILILLLSSFLINIPTIVYGANTIAVIPKATILNFWKIVCTGAHAAVQDNDNILIWRGPRIENQASAQRHLLNYYINKHVDAIVIAPANKTDLNDLLDKAYRAGIKIIIIDSDTQTKNRHSFIATDNFKAGKLGAKLLLKYMEKSGPILLMGNSPENSSTAAREQGFIQAIQELSPGTSIITTHLKEGSAGEARLAAETIIRNTPLIAGIFAVGETSSEGVLHALHKIDKKISFVAFDYSSELINGVRNKQIDALITQTPFAIGYFGVRTAIELLDGKEIEPHMETPVRVLTLENIEIANTLKCLRNLTEEERKNCPICFN